MRKRVEFIVKTFRCSLEDIEYALEAVRVVKHEEDNNPIELATKQVMVKFLSNKQNYFLVSVKDNIVVGFAVAYELQQVYQDERELFFFEIGVLKDYKRQGVGVALIELLKQICIENKYVEMYVPTNRSNLPAMGMYKKAGGIESDSMDDVSFTWHFSYSK